MSRSSTRTARQLSAIAQGSPMVAAQRLLDFSLAAQPLSGRDLREWNRMIAEKGAAAMEGWWAMYNAVWLAPLSAGAWSLWSPWSSPWQRWSGLGTAGDRIVAAGLKPVARTVSANRARLARRRPSA